MSTSPASTDFPSLRGSQGLTPLHSSALKGQLVTVKMLMALKADPEVRQTMPCALRGLQSL